MRYPLRQLEKFPGPFRQKTGQRGHSSHRGQQGRRRGATSQSQLFNPFIDQNHFEPDKTGLRGHPRMEPGLTEDLLG